MNVSGKANYEQMMSLVVRGVPVWDYLAKAMHKPVGEIQELMSKGLLPADVAIKAVSDGMNHDFAGSAERMANSLAGLQGSLHDLASITLRNLFQPALQAIQPYLAKMVEALGNEHLQNAVKATGAAIGTFLVGALERLSQMVGPITNFAARVVSGFQTLRALFTMIVGPWQQGSNQILGIVSGLWSRITERFAGGKMRAKAWGLDTISQFASGMMAAMNVVIGAIKAIGNVLAEWLMPHSPPKVAPNIDTWGEQTGEQYGIGIGRADVGKHIGAFGERLRDQLQAEFAGLDAEDLGLVEQLQGTISGVLQSIASGSGMKDGALNGLLKGLQGPIVAAVKELKETGNVSEATFRRLRAAAGPAGPAIEKVTRAYVDLNVATKKVSAAQKELNDIEKRYQDLTKPVDAQLDEVGRQRQQIADQKRMVELQKVMTDASADGADRADAALEMQEIQLNAQKRALETQQKSETDVAQQKLDAATREQQEAENRVKREEETLKLYSQQADLTKQMIAATKAAGSQQAGALKLVRDQVKGVTDAVNEAKDKAESFAETIKKSGDDAVARAKEFRDNAVAAWNTFTANPLVAGLIRLGSTIANFIAKDWKPLLGAILGGAAAWAAPGLFVPVLGFFRLLTVLGPAVLKAGGIFGVLKTGLMTLFSPFNIVIALGALLGAAWGANFANIRRLSPELLKLGDLFKGVFKALLGGDIKGALKFAGPIMEQLGNLRSKVWEWIQEATPQLIAILKPWAIAFGNWVTDTALPWLGQKLGELASWLWIWIQHITPPLLAQLATWGKLFGNWVTDTALPWLGQKLGELWAWLVNWIQANGPGILAQLQAWGTMFGSWVADTALPWLGEKAGELIAWLLDWIVANGPGIAEQLLVWADMFGDWIIQTALPWLGEQVAKLGQWLLDWIIAYGPGILSTLGTWAVKFAEWVPIGLGLLIVALGVLLGKFLGWVIENGPTLLRTLGTWAEQFSTFVGNVITWLVNEGLPKFGAWIRDDLGPAFVTGLVAMFGIIGTKIAELWNAAWAPGTLGDQLLTNIKTALNNVWPNIKNYFATKWAELWGQSPPQPTNTTNSTTGAAPTGSPREGTKKLPGFAKGVKDFGGGYAWTGEEGPELIKLPTGSDVIPTPQVGDTLRKVGAGGGPVSATLQLNIQNPVVDSQARIAELVEKIRSVVSGDLERMITQITLDTL
ncbi:hypothetical protein SE17_12950 [Kouleothrix aurantiaca]|uniref:Tape measure protein n=1 Tax=Kouleothrix aurantiaca TaxID=186479 RepID=A0A0P9D4L2_9CHLR|nr:hypothetical protein SE17_12950 [Kouleothrix aurantiaca]